MEGREHNINNGHRRTQSAKAKLSEMDQQRFLSRLSSRAAVGEDDGEENNKRQSRASKTSKAPSNGASPSPRSKSSKGAPSSICNKRLELAYEAVLALNDTDVETKEDIIELCDFVPEEPFNFGCPILLSEEIGFLTPEDFENKTVAEAYSTLTKFCECHAGYDLGCAGKIPHGPPRSTYSYSEDNQVYVPSYSEYIPFSSPTSRAEYCQFVGVWNGDFDINDVEISQELEECGCFFISMAKEMVRDCPGVDFGAF